MGTMKQLQCKFCSYTGNFIQVINHVRKNHPIMYKKFRITSKVILDIIKFAGMLIFLIPVLILYWFTKLFVWLNNILEGILTNVK